jgi:hypothetical protein
VSTSSRPENRDHIVKASSVAHSFGLASFCFFVALLPGCGERSVNKGTEGVLRVHNEPIGNMRVTVNRVDKKSVTAIGFGVTADDGTFRLVTNGGRTGLRLAPGEYCCTLKSVGSQVRVPNEYAQVNTTPLKISWSEKDKTLNLVFRIAAKPLPTP